MLMAIITPATNLEKFRMILQVSIFFQLKVIHDGLKKFRFGFYLL